MKVKKFLLAGFAGCITYLLLGWVFYGILLTGLVNETLGTTIGVDRLDMNPWAMIGGNLSMGFLLAFVFIYVGDVSSMGTGAVTGAAIGLFCSTGFDMILYSTNYLGRLPGFLIDIIAFSLISGLTGAVIGGVAGSDQKSPDITIPTHKK